MIGLYRMLRIPSIALALGLYFVAERFLEASKFKPWVIGLCFLLCVISIAASRLLQVEAKKQGYKGEAQSYFYTYFWQVGAMLSLAFYWGYAKVLPASGAPETFGQKALLALWLLSMLISLFAGIGGEVAMKSCGTGPYGEPRRVARAMVSWSLVGTVLCAFMGFNYAGAKKDKVFDLSYLKVTQPGESTLKMAGTLTEDLHVSAFFPETNDVRPFVEEYLGALSRKEPRVKVEFLDKDLFPTKAEELRVSTNGQIILEMGGKRERVELGTTLSGARNGLKKLDAEFQKVFLSLTSVKKTVYFTRGHGESSWIGSSSSDTPLKSLRGLEGMLRDQNYSVRFWGMAEGSANEVPADASAVAIVGASQPFLKEEIESMRGYLKKGGRMLVYLDHAKASDSKVAAKEGTDDPLTALLAETGIQYHSEVLANDKNYVVATRSPVDKWFIVTNSFTSHESVTSLARHDERVAMIALESGYLTVTPNLGNWKAAETVRSLSDTFIDLNRNYTFDQDKEKRGSYTLGAIAVMPVANAAAAPTPVPTPGQIKPLEKPVDKTDEKPAEARVVVFSTGSAISDVLLQSPGNVLYGVDALKWLVGESKTSGTISTEEDVKIQHTRDKDAVWFYLTVAGVPLLVLLAGYFATRRGSSRRKVMEHAN